MYSKTPEQMEKLMGILKKSFLTKNLTNFEIKIIADAMYPKRFVKDDCIITYGDLGSEYYVLENGNVEVIVYKEGTDPNDPELNRKMAFAKFLTSGVSFGEIALLYNERRTATVKAVDTCDTWVLEGKVFKNIIIKSALSRRNIEISFLDKVAIFRKPFMKANFE